MSYGVAGIAQSLISIDDRVDILNPKTSALLNEKLEASSIHYVESVNFSKKCSYLYVKLYAREKALWATMTNCDDEILANDQIDGAWLELNEEEVIFLISRFIKQNINNTVVITAKEESPIKPNENNKEDLLPLFENEKTVDGIVNEHSSRYFFGPSSNGLKQGEFYYQTTWGLLHDLQYGITDHFSIGFGAPIIPLVGYITPKFSFNLNDNVSASIGSINGFSAFGPVLSIYYGTLTFGNANNNLTIGGGVAAPTNYPTAVLNISGMKQLSPYMYLITENYILPEYAEVFGFSGLRVVLKQKDINCLNVGLAYFPSLGFDFVPAFPMISYAHKFGKKI